MNDLQICNENDRIINMRIESLNKGLDLYDVMSKKGPREFITKMGELSLRAQQIHLEEDKLRQQYAMTELQENNRYRLAVIESRNIEIEAQNKVDLAKIKAISEYKQAELAANKEIKLKELDTQQLLIKEQSKCFQKLLDVKLEAYTKEMAYYESTLASVKDFYHARIQELEQYSSVLDEQYDSNFENQEAHAHVYKQRMKLKKEKNKMAEKFNKIVSDLNTKVEKAKKTFDDSISEILG